MQIFQTSTSDIGIERVRKVRQLESQILRLVRCWLYEVRWTKSGDCPKKNLQEGGKSTAAKKLRTRRSTSQKKGKEEKVARKQLEKRRSVLLSRYRFIFLHDRGRG